MVKIQKANGSLEEFSRAKLESSLVMSGASKETAKKVSSSVKPLEGMKSAELRRSVAAELTKESASLSSAYSSTKRASTRVVAELASGVARMSDEQMAALGLKAGSKATLLFEGKSLEVKVERAAGAAHRDVMLSKADLQKLGAREGSRIAVRSEMRR